MDYKQQTLCVEFTFRDRKGRQIQMVLILFMYMHIQAWKKKWFFFFTAYYKQMAGRYASQI